MVKNIFIGLICVIGVVIVGEGVVSTVNTHNAFVYKQTQMLQAQKELVEAHTRLLEEETMLLVKQRANLK